MDWYFVGLDLGQRRDHTAIAVIERTEVKGEFDYAVRAYRRVVSLRLRYLNRIALGTPYPAVVNEVVRIVSSPVLAGRCHLAIDGTGVGPAVVDLLRQARPPAVLMPVTITGGQTENMAGGFYRVPKRDLIVGLQVLLESGGLQISTGLAFAPKLVEEMMSMEVRTSDAGNEQFAAWREGSHDDLVFAVALAYWNEGKVFSRMPQGDRRWWTNDLCEDPGGLFRRWKAEEGYR